MSNKKKRDDSYFAAGRRKNRKYMMIIIPAIAALAAIGVAAAVLNHPANGPAWLANKIAPHGEWLEPGQIILGGSFTAPVFARPGDSFHVDYGPLGSISVQFA